MKGSYRPKEIAKRKVADKLEIIWNLKPAYPHLRDMTTDDLVELTDTLDYYESVNFRGVKENKKPGYARQIIKAIKSLKNEKLEVSE